MLCLRARDVLTEAAAIMTVNCITATSSPLNMLIPQSARHDRSVAPRPRHGLHGPPALPSSLHPVWGRDTCRSAVRDHRRQSGRPVPSSGIVDEPFISLGTYV